MGKWSVRRRVSCKWSVGRWSVGRWSVVLIKPKLYDNISDIYTWNNLQHLNNDKLFYQLSRTCNYQQVI